MEHKEGDYRECVNCGSLNIQYAEVDGTYSCKDCKCAW